MKILRVTSLLLAGSFVFFAILSPLSAQQRRNQPDDQAKHPWMNHNLSPDERAEMVLKEMTLDEKIDLLHGQAGWGEPTPNILLSNGGAGFTLGIKRLGIPIIQMSDAAYGVRGSAENGRYSTALPSNIGLAASWDPQAACEYGALIGRELRFQGFNMTLGGGTDITREPRNGRTFEYQGEDPILAGTMSGNMMKCEQAQHVIGDIKHYAVNDQESGRNEVDSVISKRALRESDLLAFQIGIEIGNPGAVMCSYNAVNGTFACENKYLLTDVLKKDWKFPGFVVSDWGGTHSTVEASAAGLDNEEPGGHFFGDALKKAAQDGKVPMAEIDDHVRRILRTEFADGVIDDPPQKGVVDVLGGLEIARRLEQQSIVLLKNNNGALPLEANAIHSIAIIGPHADMGMISGGGSAQVAPPGRGPSKWLEHVWFPTSPMKAIAAKALGAEVKFDSGTDPATAAEVARKSDVAIVFAYQWESEGMDLPNLSLPENQNAIIDAVAAANPRTIVVLETGTAVTMPWLHKVSAVLEAWYAGSDGANAVADVLFGNVNPSAKLPMTFPRSEADLPHPVLITPPRQQGQRRGILTKPTFAVNYDEGLKVGYKWYDAENKPVLFPFGYGLSYTTFAYSDLKVVPGRPDGETSVVFTVKNTGNRAGDEVAQVYASLPPNAGEPPKRLVAWHKIHLDAGEGREVVANISRGYLSVYDEGANGWKLVPGSYTFMVGGSSQDLPLTERFELK